MPTELILFLGLPAVLLCLATGMLPRRQRSRGGDPVAVPRRAVRR